MRSVFLLNVTVFPCLEMGSCLFLTSFYALICSMVLFFITATTEKLDHPKDASKLLKMYTAFIYRFHFVRRVSCHPGSSQTNCVAQCPIYI